MNFDLLFHAHYTSECNSQTISTDWDAIPSGESSCRATAEQVRTFWKSRNMMATFFLVQTLNRDLINLQVNRHVSFFLLLAEVFKRFLI